MMYTIGVFILFLVFAMALGLGYRIISDKKL